MKIPKEVLKQIRQEKYNDMKEVYKELLEKFKKCGNLHIEERWDESDEKYKSMRTNIYINAIESVMCYELQKLKDDVEQKDGE